MSALSFFQPWMAIIAIAVIVGALTHKRRYFQPPKALSLAKQILLVSAIYLLPASLAWFFIAGVGLHAFADSGHTISGAVASACTALGVCALGFLILRAELTEARKRPPRW